MSGISLGGLISGMDTTSVIEKLMEVEAQRIKLQEQKKATLANKQAAWNSVQSSLSTLRQKLDAIRLSTIYHTRTATVAEPSVVSVVTGTKAIPGVHNLVVDRLATNHKIASEIVADGAAALGLDGALTIGDKSVAIAAGDSLTDIAAKINAEAGETVSAEVVKLFRGNAVAYQLVLTAKESGEAGAISLGGSMAEAAALGFKDEDGDLIHELVAAKNAAFTLDGISHEWGSNSLEDVLPGVNLTLKKVGSSSITVSANTDGVANAVQEWIDQVNATVAQLTQLTKYDPTTKTAGPLSGEMLTTQIASALRSSILAEFKELPEGFRSMADLGITTGAWGTADFGKFVLDKEKLQAKVLENQDAVASLFGATRFNVAAGMIPGGWTNTASNELLLAFDQGKQIDQIELFTPDGGGIHGLKAYRLEYRAPGDPEGTWRLLEAVTSHTGAYRRFDFDGITAIAVRLVVDSTFDGRAEVTDLKVNAANRGTAAQMYQYVNGTLLATKGAVTERTAGLTTRMNDIDKQIQRIKEQLVVREKQLRAQFTRMEAILSSLQSQGNALMTTILGSMAQQQR